MATMRPSAGATKATTAKKSLLGSGAGAGAGAAGGGVVMPQPVFGLGIGQGGANGNVGGTPPQYSTGGGGGGGGDMGGGGYGGGTGGAIGGMGGGMAPPPVVAAPSEEDYLAGDSGFQTQQSALKAALERYLADSDFQKTTYNNDYGRSLRDLGYDEGTKQWNFQDKLTAAGRGYQAQLDDFGNRGMLQSSAYADANNELQRMLGQQYDTMASGKQTFLTDMENQVANFKGENTSNSQAARAEALQRRAMQYGL